MKKHILSIGILFLSFFLLAGCLDGEDAAKPELSNKPVKSVEESAAAAQPSPEKTTEQTDEEVPSRFAEDPQEAAASVIPATEPPTEPPETEPPTEAPTEPPETEAPTEAPTEPPETEPPTEAPTVPPVTEPPTVPPATEPPIKEIPETEEEEEITYIGNANSWKFHYPWCSSVDDMNESNKVYFTCTREEIIAMGYDPCKRCKP